MSAGSATAQETTKSAEEMLAAIHGIKPPTMTKEMAQDPAKIRAFFEAQNKASRDRSELILAFYRAYPDHPETPKLMQQRWTSLRRPARS